jgi:lipoyl(octanoyl) transferase
MTATRAAQLDVHWLGRRPYAEVWQMQKELLEARIQAAEQDGPRRETLLLVEHEPVYTWGKRTASQHLGAGPEQLRALGAAVFEVERGGEVTYHGPGQLVGYPICHLASLRCGRDLHRYLRGLEETLILALAEYGLSAERIPGLTGVWMDGAKVAAIGVRVRKWCTMHGFALNVSNALLPWFRHITPCGISDRPVTTLEGLIGRAPDMEDVRAKVEGAFRRVLIP